MAENAAGLLSQFVALFPSPLWEKGLSEAEMRYSRLQR